MKTNKIIRILMLLFLVLGLTVSAHAGNFYLKYEQVVRDSYGNEVGYKTNVITDINQLPTNSPWRDYLNIKLANGKTIYQFASTISKDLNNDFTMIISDRDQNSYSCKTKNGYQINLYDYVNNYASESSKAFLFLHEFGHTTMLNSYPGSYDFRDLDYGPDGVHYLDEILPNHNTAWVEGWANAFGAHNNNGKIFSIDINSNASLAFLRNNTFDERARNELFVSKVVFDMIRKIPNGQASVYNAFAKTGPHHSLYEFCNKYSQMYPQHKGLLAQILMEASLNQASLDDILLYINGGSKTVTPELYSSLVGLGLINNQGQQVAGNKGNVKPAEPKKQSIFGKLFSWIGRLFGFSDTSGALASTVDTMHNTGASGTINTQDYRVPTDGSLAVKGSITGGGDIKASSPYSEKEKDVSFNGSEDYLELQEAYYRYFAEYNKLMLNGNPDRDKVGEITSKMRRAKIKLKELEKNR